MDLVYKYMPYECLLKTLTPAGVFLKVVNPAEFNDPFDCTGTAVGQWPQKFIDANKATFGGHALDAQECLKSALEGRRLFGDAYRIICFADKIRMIKSGREKLMWAHYADNCRGVRLCFDAERIGFSLSNVRYRKRLPTLNFRKLSSMRQDECEELRRFNHECLTVKDVCWNYECERRAIFDSSDPRIDRDENGVDIVEVPRSAIMEVALGSEIEVCKVLRRRLLSLGVSADKFVVMDRVGFDFAKRHLTEVGCLA